MPLAPLDSRPAIVEALIRNWRLRYFPRQGPRIVFVRPGEWPSGVSRRVSGSTVCEDTTGLIALRPGALIAVGRTGAEWDAAVTFAAGPMPGWTSDQQSRFTAFITFPDDDGTIAAAVSIMAESGA